jgi:uncharacterized membrane protein YfcA
MSFDVWWMAYLALGTVAGFLAGLLGIGGGGMMVPILTAIFVAQGVPVANVVHLALGTSMAVMVITSISSLRAHHLLGSVRWDIVKMITPGVVIGAFATTFLAAAVASKSLALFFACFMAFMSAQMLIDSKPKPTRELPGPLGVASVGVGIGGLSSLVAIGGAALSIPFMVWCNVKLQHAIGTSAAIGWPVAAAGAVGYMINGLGVAGMPENSIGFIYFPALATVAVAGVLTAPLGARLAHRMPVKRLKKVFAVFFMLLSLKMVHTVFF